MRIYAPVVRKACMAYTHESLDPDDIEEVGMLALWEAARRFKLRHGVPFGRFLTLVLHLRLRDAGVHARRHKNVIVRDSVREITRDWGMVDVFEVLPARTADPVRTAEAREDLSHVIHDMKFVLTHVERTAIQGLLNDRTYDDIAVEIHGDRRTVDNAVQRGRRKLAAAIT